MTRRVAKAEAAGAVATKAWPIAGADGEVIPFWVSAPPRLVGNPKPEWESFDPNGDRFHGDRCGKFAHKIKAPLFGWQADTMVKILARRPDGLWSHPDVCLIIPRQNGKSQIIILRILYGLFFLGEKIVYTAQRWSTVKDIYERLVGIIERRPSLKRRLLSTPSASGNHGLIELRNGATLNMGPRTKAVGRGETLIDLAIFDEAYEIKDTHTGDLTGAQQAADNPQTIFISTAAVQTEHPHCGTLSAMRWNGKRGEPDLYAAEWRAPDGMRRNDPEAWRLACPSYGVTVRERNIAREHRRARTSRLLALFEADYLGWGDWPPDDEEREPIIGRERWDALKNRMPLLVGDCAVAIERTRDRKVWAIAAGRRTITGEVHVELGYWRSVNIGAVGVYLIALVERLNPVAILVDDKSPARPIVEFMLKQGLEITVTNTSQLAAACAGFVDGIEAGDICHTGQALLDEAVEGADIRYLPRGDFVWDDETGQLTPLKAVTLAHYGVLKYCEEEAESALPSTGVGAGAQDLDDAYGDDVNAMAF